jgi:predicted dehydrogenase
VRTWFTFSGVPDSNYRLDPARGGGALLDVGVYAIAGALIALGHDPVVVEASHDLGPTGVDLTTSAVLASDRGRATVLGSFVQPESQGWTVVAPGVTVDVPHPAFTSWREESVLRIVEDGVERVETFAPCDAYLLMVEAVSAAIRGEDAWTLPLSTSLAVARAVDQVARQAAAVEAG